MIWRLLSILETDDVPEANAVEIIREMTEALLLGDFPIGRGS